MPTQCKRIIYEVHFKLILMYNTKVQILIKRSKNKSVIETMYKKFLRSTEGKIRGISTKVSEKLDLKLCY